MLRGEEVRLLTLTGPGGIGKTRLALEVARETVDSFPDGVIFVSLASLADPTLVPVTIAGALGIRDEGGQPILEVLLERLRRMRVLLVLDNFEHLLTARAVVSHLLAACPQLALLITSRAVLHLSAEHEYPLPPLAVPVPGHLPELGGLSRYGAVQLFVQRAKAIKPSFQLTAQNAGAVAEICTRLDGLPLAIELAAARIRLLPPPALLERLSDRLTVLTGGAKDLPSRQQTLRNTIDWSYTLLTPEEQALFARLSVFAGGCSFEAAEAVCNPGGALDLLEGMTSLVDKSLLHQQAEEEPRLSLLETIREYAAEKLDERGEGERIRAAHARYFLQLAQEANPALTGPRQSAWLFRLEEELDNMRAALRWFLDRGEHEEALQMAGLIRFWFAHGHRSEVQRWLEEGLTGGEGLAPGVRANALYALGTLATLRGDYARATPLLEEALELYRALGDRRGSAQALNTLANGATDQGEYTRASALFDESLSHWQALGDDAGRAMVLRNLGIVEARQGNLERAKEWSREALRVYRATGDTGSIAASLTLLGELALNEHDLAEAEALLAEGLELAREIGHQRITATTLCSLGDLGRERGQFERARERLEEGLRLARELGEVRLILALLYSVAALEIAVGEAERAVCLRGAEATVREGLGIPLPPVVQTEGEERLVRARTNLGDETFIRAWERGQDLSLEEAVAYALGETE